MNCHAVEECLLGFLEGVLDPSVAKDIESHLADCPRCRAELERWRRLEGKIEKGIEAMTAAQHPQRSADEILASAVGAGRGRPRRAVGLIAAGIAAMLLISPLFLPFSARVLASSPLIGDWFATAIAESGLAVAYQAGLVTELNQSVTSGDLALTVTGAYADATQTTVLFTISGAKERMRQLWDDMPKASERVSLRDSLGREYTGHSSRSGYFDEATGQYHVILETNALPFYVGRLKLGVQMRGQTVNADWSVTFPVQRVSDRLVQELPVNLSFTTSDGIPVTIDKLVFSPSRTVLHYSMQRLETSEWGTPQWSILADGQALTSVGGGGGSRGGQFAGTAAFFPTSAKELVIRYEGLVGSQELDWRLEMNPGARAQWHDIAFTIHEVRTESGDAWVRAEMQGGFIKLHDPLLELTNGRIREGKVADFEPDEAGNGGVYELHFPGATDISGATILIERAEGLRPDPWSAAVTRP